jgi:hypothetical protein
MFVYDTKRCQREEDDPQEAVLYFHPGWVNDQQRLALCGQLMGATQFFLTSFSCPRIIALNSGKFVIRQFGRYILVRSDCCDACLGECCMKIYVCMPPVITYVVCFSDHWYRSEHSRLGS